jgi:hypothetical protein
MGRLGDWLDQWEVNVATMIRRIVITEDGKVIVDADEVCFFGSVQTLPRSMGYLKSVGTYEMTPEVYVVGMKNGTMIPPNIWFASPVREHLEQITGTLMQGLKDMITICDEEGFSRPTAVKIAVVASTGEAQTKYEFDPLPKPPYRSMSLADWAFDVWVTNIQDVGSAYKEVLESKNRNKT